MIGYKIHSFINKTSVLLLWCSLLLLQTQAQVVIRTGVDPATGNSLISGNSDTRWTSFSGTYDNHSAGSGLIAVLTNIGSYASPPSGNPARWITRQSPAMTSQGYYSFEYTFNLAAVTNNMSFDASFSADNYPTKISIDNNVIWTNSSPNSNQFQSLLSISGINISTLSTGTHTLQVEIYDGGVLCSLYLDAIINGAQENPVKNLSGLIWNDINADGLMGSMSSEPTLANIPVNLYSGNTLLASTTTSNFGTYSFNGLLNGNYTIQAQPTALWEQTHPASNGTYAVTINAASPSTVGNLDFGMHYTCCTEMPLTVNNSAPFLCPGATLNFSTTCNNTGTTTVNFSWNFGDGSAAASGTNVNHTFNTAGTYTIMLTGEQNNGCQWQTQTQEVVISPCTEPCSDCVGPFAPTPGSYLIGFWVREDHASAQNYYPSGAILSFYDNASQLIGTPVTIVAPQDINVMIEGWQRVEGRFTVPVTAKYIKIDLNNATTGVDCYFDDIRIHPVDASMKSFVYDPVNLRLMAELDENNYATFYEYDEDGSLVRVKKETERGVMTLQESRGKNSKVGQ